jgi:phosphoribosylformylglycinamidine synthase
MPPARVPITPDLVREHGLTAEEYRRFTDLIGREPTIVELGIVSAMWNEHCSYKSSRLHLRGLPTSAPWVIQGPGENAGVIDIGDGQAIVFKMESHNHPSFIEPYQGAATGWGASCATCSPWGRGRLRRSTRSASARPTTRARATSWRAWSRESAATAIPSACRPSAAPSASTPATTATSWSTRWRSGSRRPTRSSTPPRPVSEPDRLSRLEDGRDGIHGATMASAAFDDKSEEKRPTVQVGDPFAEKLLLEACLELMKSGAVIAIQDMGAAGLTCSAVEMGAKGDLGVELWLERVPAARRA